jgi:hypothetical protein
MTGLRSQRVYQGVMHPERLDVLHRGARLRIVSRAGAFIAVVSLLTVEPAAWPRAVDTIRAPAALAPQRPTTLSTRPDERTTLSIPATAPWTDTGLTLRVGDHVQLRAWGAVTFGDASRRNAMPRGAGPGGGCAFVVMDRSVPAEALVANIAGEMTFDGRGFLVASNWEGTLPVTGSTATEGRLFLGFNHGAMLCDRSGYDSWSFRNRNGGAFTVELTIWRASR